MGRKIILYDLYKNDEYQGRYKAKELMYLLGMSRETIASRVYHGVKAKDGYEIMRAEPDEWAESWERACAPLRRCKNAKDNNCISSPGRCAIVPDL